MNIISKINKKIMLPLYNQVPAYDFNAFVFVILIKLTLLTRPLNLTFLSQYKIITNLPPNDYDIFKIVQINLVAHEYSLKATSSETYLDRK